MPIQNNTTENIVEDIEDTENEDSNIQEINTNDNDNNKLGKMIVDSIIREDTDTVFKKTN